MSPDEFAGLLASLVHLDHVDTVRDALEIVETENVPPERVVIPLPAGSVAARVRNTKGFEFLLPRGKNKAPNADGPFVIVLPDGSMLLLIIECKKTLGQDEWLKARRQFASSLRRLLALCGALRLPTTRVLLGTAYREDAIANPDSPHLSFAEPNVGPDFDPSTDPRWQWERGRVYLDGLPQMAHAQLQLGDDGHRTEPLAALLARAPASQLG